MKGLFITFEGGEGVGKSTLIQRINKKLSESHSIFITREPGGTELGEQIRFLLKHVNLKIDPKTELLLFSAARAQLFTNKIQPQLDANQIVLSDRFFDSTIVYQGYARGLDLTIIRQLNTFVTNARSPDMTFLILADKQTTQNVQERGGIACRFDAEPETFHDKVHRGFEELAKIESRIIQIPYIHNGLEQMEKMIMDKILKHPFFHIT
ncbi:MAG: dTMP kinase [Candidatus Woesearchaeota archaeon]|jgi:dTMP kinase